MAWTIDPFGAETDALARVVDFRGSRVLEVGAGDGRLTWRYAAEAAEVLGIDPNEEEVARALEELPPELAGRVRFVTADVASLDVRDGSYDVALLSWSL